VGVMLREALPGAFVTLSCEILPEIREYERTSTTVINAYIGPIVSRYIDALTQALRVAGVEGKLLVMQSGGGILGASNVMQAPANIVECGPAAGVIGALRLAEHSGERNVITFDMGGTTAKASLIENGRVTRSDEYEVAGGISLSSRLVKGGGYALKLPVIDISEVGAGGGSIVWFDSAGALKIGPHSAGAVPGPACYDAGGTEPTVTDANVVLGFINPNALAGGTMPIRGELSHAVIGEHVAGRLGVSLREAAWAVHAIAASSMMRAVKAVSTYRGRNPADFVLMAFGGNGGIFAAELVRQLEMLRIIVPAGAGAFSAIGLGVADLAFGRTCAVLARTDRLDPAMLNAALRNTEHGVVGALGSQKPEIRRLAMMRYAGQAFELAVTLPPDDLTRSDLDTLALAFEREHERQYGHRLNAAEGIEIVAAEVIATTPTQRRLPRLAPGHGDRTPDRVAYFGPAFGTVTTPVVHRFDLDSRGVVGPMIIEEYEGTTIVPPDARAHRDDCDNVVVELAA
ncbi:MAG: hydantoinase/oxoprolinase family protein, partial [Methylobacteriaceae bacterium]|nr:hydantoinase/oxoprolinase family protein [Methylobacteriaceae bacterium]